MPGYNLPDHVSPNDPEAPWNQVEHPTRVYITVHYAGQTATFETEWDWCPSEEEAALDFGENYYVTV
ncbi:MAG: hypothetical protein JRI59_08445, partial [Deltaproteobacteria bacterium]|nr:hypothetical protein [Deltaproteobacteria bacterium]